MQVLYLCVKNIIQLLSCFHRWIWRQIQFMHKFLFYLIPSIMDFIISNLINSYHKIPKLCNSYHLDWRNQLYQLYSNVFSTFNIFKVHVYKFIEVLFLSSQQSYPLFWLDRPYHKILQIILWWFHTLLSYQKTN